MEPRRKKIVQISIDGGDAHSLHLELEPVVGDDSIALRLVHILSRAIQGRPFESLGVHWDQEHLRESDAFIRQIVGRFNGVWGSTAPRRAASGRVSRKRTAGTVSPALRLTD